MSISKKEMLKMVSEKISICEKCPELVKNRTKTVPGDGNYNSKLVFLAEAPGQSEDLRGKPFVGRAGELLTNLLKACGLDRENDIYILNILKCRPPANRTPTPEEAGNCHPFLDLQLKVINPSFIVCLGATATRYLLGVDNPIGQMRGKWYKHRDAKVLCTYHPSYGLRVSSAKHEIYKDLMLLVKELKTKQ